MREHPERIGEVQAQLSRWRTQSGSTRSDPYLDTWEKLLGEPVDVLEQRVCGNSDAAAALRNVSPMSVLITQRERTGLLQKARCL